MTEPARDPAVDSDDELTQLDPRHITVSRISSAIFMMIFVIGAGVLEAVQVMQRGAIIIPVLIAAIYIAWIVPARKYRHWGYHMAADRLRIVRGFMFYSDTIVPFGRIQHIDVDQGPIQRPYNLATLQVHTAGNHNSTVALPGLTHETALAMREAIRARIKRDAL
jgi:membrane protein YdbS with pleckstrin-like domain